MFIHGKRINDRLYVKTVGGNWIELRTLSGMQERKRVTPFISYTPGLYMLNGSEAHTVRNFMQEHI